MTSMERILTVMEGKTPDRKPLALLTSLYGARLTSCPLDRYYSVAEEYVKGQNAALEIGQSDVIFTPFILTGEAEAFGCVTVPVNKNPPNLKKPVLRSFEEIRSLKVPDLENQKRLMYIAEATERLGWEHKGKKPIAAPMTSPFDLPSLLLGIEGWLETILFHREQMNALLEITGEFFVRWTSLLIERGADFIVIPSMFTSPTLVTEKIIIETILPYLSRVFGKAEIPIVFHHGGNPIGPYINLYSSLPNIAAFVIDPKDSFAEIRNTLENPLLLMGNMNGPAFKYWSREILERKVRDLMDDRKDDPYFILTSSNADIAYDTPEEGIRALRGIADEYL